MDKIDLACWFLETWFGQKWKHLLNYMFFVSVHLSHCRAKNLTFQLCRTGDHPGLRQRGRAGPAENHHRSCGFKPAYQCMVQVLCGGDNARVSHCVWSLMSDVLVATVPLKLQRCLNINGMWSRWWRHDWLEKGTSLKARACSQARMGNLIVEFFSSSSQPYCTFMSRSNWLKQYF